MYLSRHHTKDSYPDLARAFGGKHHTTVISAVQKIAERVKDDASLRSEIHAIEAMILQVIQPCGSSLCTVRSTVERSWTDFVVGVVHTFAAWHPPYTDDVRPLCVASSKVAATRRRC